MIRYFLFAGLSILLFSTGLIAQAGHTIRGKVKTADGANVPQAIVELQTGNGARLGQTTTNNEGDFYYVGLNENSYLLTVSSPDFQPVSQDVRFVRTVSPNEPGETQYVEIVLRPKNRAASPRPGPVFVQDLPPEARKKFDDANKLLKEKNTDKALSLIQESLTLFPDFFEARMTLGSELMKGGKLNEAIVELEKARKINPKEPRLYQLVGMILSQKKMPDAAAQAFAEAVKLNPSDPQLQFLYATALIDSTVSLDPAKPADADKKARLLKDAETALSTAFQLSDKKMFVTYLQMARVYEKRNEPKRAADELEKYLKSSPNDKNAVAIRSAIDRLRGKS